MSFHTNTAVEIAGLTGEFDMVGVQYSRLGRFGYLSLT